MSTPKNNIEQPITHKHTVRYLGKFIHLDERLHYKNHLEIQLKKAIKAFMQHKKLFYSKHLHPKVKIMLSTSDKTHNNIWMPNMVQY